MDEIALRSAAEADRDLLYEVYASTRWEELTPVEWDEATKLQFLRQQFDAQDAYYKANYRDTSYDVILVGGEPAGRLYVARWAEELRIVDIALLPRFRGRGVGTTLLRGLMDEADAAGKPLSIHVEVNNPARSLYDRLGFEEAEDRGVYVLMRRPPAAS
ncbi:MAG: GNAT family N-acetyltransferase [Actinomycetota bacterium]|nr:GNAT family N-acetyltransferase [Actinomycetota bacterium]